MKQVEQKVLSSLLVVFTLLFVVVISTAVAQTIFPSQNMGNPPQKVLWKENCPRMMELIVIRDGGSGFDVVCSGIPSEGK